MPQFRKLPVAIEARQLTNNNTNDQLNGLVNWIQSNGGNAGHDGTDIYIHTLEGTMKANLHDWIIRGVQGEFYPCKPDIFKSTYELVD